MSPSRNHELVRRYLVALAWNVRALRLRAGLTQVDLAERASINVKHLQRVEAGIDPRLSMIVHLAEALSTQPSDLLKLNTHPANLPAPKKGRPKK